MKTIPLLTIPGDTALAARSIFSLHNVYITIGDQFDQLLGDLNLDDLDASGNHSTLSSCIMALVTIFQAGENLSDWQAAEALGKRTDWKYALHLSMDYPGLNPSELCKFRQQLLTNARGQAEFQRMLTRMIEVGLFSIRSKDRLDTRYILLSVCFLTRFEWVVQAMYQALEAMAAYQPEMLSAVALPHWYDRYNHRKQKSSFQKSEQKQRAKILEIAADIQYFLGEIDKAHDPDLTALQEVQGLRKIFGEQFVTNSDKTDHAHHVQWRFHECDPCGLGILP